MTIKTFLALAIATCFALISFGCGGGAANTTANATANKAANTATTSTTTTTSSTTATTAPANSAETAKTAPAGDSVGVPECDEYITKYEACLTKIAKAAPQVEPTLKSSFEAQRNGFKSAAATPQGKATLASTCKTAIETAKTATKAYSCDW